MNLSEFVRRGAQSVTPNGPTPALSTGINPESFKAQVPATVYGNHGRSMGPPLRNQHVHPRDRSDMFGTDAGSIDDSVGVVDNHNNHALDEPDDQVYDDGEEDSEEDNKPDEDLDDDDPDVIDVETKTGFRPVSRLREPDLHRSVAQSMANNRRNAAQTDPSSYPPTTSGEPSVVAQEEHRPVNQPRQQPLQQSSNPHHAHDNRATRQSLPVPPPPIQTQKQANSQTVLTVPVHSHNPVPPRNVANGQRTIQAHRQTVPATHFSHRTVLTKKDSKNAEPAFDTRLQENRRGNDALPDTPHSDNDPIDDESPGPDTDYDEATLFKMDFAQLQAQDYDVDLRNPRHDPDRDMTGDELDNQLAHHQNLSKQEQSVFFASLNIDEWEHAGDWFQAKFADMFQRFKENRRDKRKSSYGFEARIAERHGMVVKKRKTTDDALQAMKGAGASVLDTPRKMRQKKS